MRELLCTLAWQFLEIQDCTGPWIASSQSSMKLTNTFSGGVRLLYAVLYLVKSSVKQLNCGAVFYESFTSVCASICMYACMYVSVCSNYSSNSKLCSNHVDLHDAAWSMDRSGYWATDAHEWTPNMHVHAHVLLDRLGPTCEVTLRLAM